MYRRKILIADDEPVFTRLVSEVLTGKGHEVLTAGDGREALRLFFDHRPDLVLLDVVMPRMDGWQTCNRIREMSDVPIAMLSGRRRSEQDIVRGLDCGADDYLVKPVGKNELVARVRAMLRRAGSAVSPETGKSFSDGFLTVDTAGRKVAVGGEPVRLTPTEFRLLALLVAGAGRVLTHRQLLEKVWGWEYANDVDYVRVYIWHLRQKIEPDPAHPRYIITEPGVGYCFQGAAAASFAAA